MELDFNKLGNLKIHWRSYDLANTIGRGDSIFRGAMMYILIASNPSCPLNRGTLAAEYYYAGQTNWRCRGVRRYINTDGILRLPDINILFKVEQFPTQREIIKNKDWTIITPLRIFNED